MITDHDGASATSRPSADLVAQPAPSEEDAERGVQAVLSMLPHVSDCDGPAIFMEKMEPAVPGRIAENIAEVREAGPGLLDWAGSVRGRPV